MAILIHIYLNTFPPSYGCIARLAAYRFKYGTKKKPAPSCRRHKIVETEDEEAQPAEDDEDNCIFDTNKTAKKHDRLGTKVSVICDDKHVHLACLLRMFQMLEQHLKLSKLSFVPFG
jgi:hypothetical protein